jgi:hypothetical protein
MVFKIPVTCGGQSHWMRFLQPLGGPCSWSASVQDCAIGNWTRIPRAPALRISLRSWLSSNSAIFEHTNKSAKRSPICQLLCTDSSRWYKSLSGYSWSATHFGNSSQRPSMQYLGAHNISIMLSCPQYQYLGAHNITILSEVFLQCSTLVHTIVVLY